MNNRTTEAEYLIIGNSAGGIGAAEAIREVNKTSPIIIVTDEPYLAYSRPLISEYLSGERTVDEMLFRPADFYDLNNIELFNGNKAVKLELDKKAIVIDNGERILWKKLLMATGGNPIVPDIKGLNKRGVFTFLALDNAKAILGHVNRVKRAVVIGGGLIGISVTEALMKLGIQVNVIEMKDRVLNTILDEEASLIVEDFLKQKGVGIIANNTISKINGRSSVDSVVLSDGQRISCEMVIIAIGVLPRTDLALNTAIKVNRGILVDRHMATSYPDIYACGDTAEAYDFIYNINRVIPVWPNAYIGGRVAGYNMAGKEVEYPGGTAMNSLNYFGMDIATAGIIATQDSDNYEVINRIQGDIYQKVILSDDFIVGMVFVGCIEKSGIVFGLMRDRVKVDSFKEMLLSEDFGLACLPVELRRERLSAVPQTILNRY